MNTAAIVTPARFSYHEAYAIGTASTTAAATAAFSMSDFFVILCIDDGLNFVDAKRLRAHEIVKIAEDEFGVTFKSEFMTFREKLDVSLRLLNSRRGICYLFEVNERGAADFVAVARVYGRAKDAQRVAADFQDTLESKS